MISDPELEKIIVTIDDAHKAFEDLYKSLGEGANSSHIDHPIPI